MPPFKIKNGLFLVSNDAFASSCPETAPCCFFNAATPRRSLIASLPRNPSSIRVVRMEPVGSILARVDFGGGGFTEINIPDLTSYASRDFFFEGASSGPSPSGCTNQVRERFTYTNATSSSGSLSDATIIFLFSHELTGGLNLRGNASFLVVDWGNGALGALGTTTCDPTQTTAVGVGGNFPSIPSEANGFMGSGRHSPKNVTASGMWSDAGNDYTLDVSFSLSFFDSSDVERIATACPSVLNQALEAIGCPPLSSLQAPDCGCGCGGGCGDK